MRVAVFVDAGYLYAAGSSAITGLKKIPAREDMVLRAGYVIDLLKAQVSKCAKGKELLRIYWYDGAPLTGPSTSQTEISNLDDVKLRLGQLNVMGQQKGVDALIVTDMMELARNKAISDALLVTGDEDIRIGVQIAQSLGIRVHLLGISGPASQSMSLQQEADTVSQWTKENVSSFLSIKPRAPETLVSQPVAKKITTHKAAPKPATKKAAPAKMPPIQDTEIEEVDPAVYKRLAEQTVSLLKDDKAAFKRVAELVEENDILPTQATRVLYDGLAKVLGRDAFKPEQKLARNELKEKLKAEINVA